MGVVSEFSQKTTYFSVNFTYKMHTLVCTFVRKLTKYAHSILLFPYTTTYTVLYHTFLLFCYALAADGEESKL